MKQFSAASVGSTARYWILEQIRASNRQKIARQKLPNSARAVRHRHALHVYHPTDGSFESVRRDAGVSNESGYGQINKGKRRTQRRGVERAAERADVSDTTLAPSATNVLWRTE